MPFDRAMRVQLFNVRSIRYGRLAEPLVVRPHGSTFLLAVVGGHDTERTRESTCSRSNLDGGATTDPAPQEVA
ncbi:hypothetical protein ASF45_26465 [Pseudorhodoferax sp. Leaf265]|nr:hypothetical protein ASF45_26465 [Pseudorhodoferax sp. Leaf265]